MTSLGEDEMYEAGAKVSGSKPGQVEQGNEAVRVGEANLVSQVAEQTLQASGNFEIGGLEINMQMIGELWKKFGPLIIGGLAVAHLGPQGVPLMMALMESGMLNKLFGDESGQSPDNAGVIGVTTGADREARDIPTSTTPVETPNARLTDFKEAFQNFKSALTGREYTSTFERLNDLGHAGIDLGAAQSLFPEGFREKAEQFLHQSLNRVLPTKPAGAGA